MAIAQRTNGTANYYNGSPSGPTTVSKPAAVLAGDVAIVCGAANGVSWTTPAGWTAIQINVNAGGLYLAAWYRVIQAGDTSWNFSTSGLAACGLVFVAFTGVNTSNPIDVSGASSTASNSTNVVANSITIATSGAFWMNATAALYAATNPQFTASGFTEYDNGSVAGNFPVGLLWQGPMVIGATGTSTITASRSLATGQYVIAIPFALAVVPPTVISAVAVSTAIAIGSDTETVIVPGVASNAMAKVDIGFSDRMIEGGGVRQLENNSVRLLEGSALVSAVKVIVQSPSQVMTGFIGTISIPAIVTSVTAVAVVATGFTPSTSVRDLIGIAAAIAVGTAATTQATASIATSSVTASGFAAPIKTADLIGSVAVFASGNIGTGSLTIGGGTYLNANAVSASMFSALAGTRDLIGLTASSASFGVSVITLNVGGSTSLGVNAVGATSFAGSPAVIVTESSGAVITSGLVPPAVTSTRVGAIPVNATAWAGVLTEQVSMSPTLPATAGLAAGLAIASTIIVTGSVAATGLVGGTIELLSVAGLATGFTAFAGSMAETIRVNQPAASSIWFPGTAVAIKVFNVSAHAVSANAFAGNIRITTVIDASAVLATAWASMAIAIPAPPLDTGPGITMRMPVDQFGGPMKVGLSAVDRFASSSIAVRMPVDQFGSPCLIVTTKR